MPSSISKHASIVAVKDQISCNLDSDSVILQLKTGTYYGLNAVGATIWNHVQKPRTVAEICDIIQKEYEVEALQCERDVLAVLEDLARAGLIEVGGAPGS